MPATLKERVAALEADMEIMKAELERSQALVGIEKGIRAMNRGEGLPLRAALAFEKMRKKHKIPTR
jgi:hypothetical protein